MNSFADQKKIFSYSLALAEKMTSDFFSSKDKVETSDIKVFSKVDQLNLFLIKNLFEKWQEETLKLKSPYFDYSSGEVQSSLQNLLNVLSNHISISKEFFKPLLEKAINDTLLFVLDPLLYFKTELLAGDNISLDSLKKSEKFFKANKNYFQAIKDGFKNSPNESRPCNEILKELIQKGLQPEETNSIITHFSSLLKFELNDMLIEPELKPVQITELPVPVEQAVSENYLVKDDANLKTNEIIDQQLTTAETPEKSALDSELPLNERFSKEEKTLNELLAKNATDGIKGERIEDLRSAIPLNERFLYIKELFNDNPSEFAIAVAELEKAQNLNSALELIKINYVEKFNWDINNPYCGQFIQLVERRFSE